MSARQGVPRPGTGRPGFAARSGGWLAGRTLRTRLVAGLLALFTIASVGVALATPAAMQPYLLGRLNQQLAAASNAFLASNPVPGHGPGGPGGPDRHGGQNGHGAPGHGHTVLDAKPNLPHQGPGTLGVCLYGDKVTTDALVTGYNGKMTAPRLTGADIATLRSLRPGTPASVHLAGIGSYQVLASRQGNVTDVTGLPLASVEATIRHLQLIEIIVFGGALLVIGLAATGWIRLTLRPLTRITATATEVTGLPLASGAVQLPHRVPDADPRTEVGQLGVAFNRMLGHVESALARRQASEDRLRSFAADASHELRTPLAAIRGYAQLARRQASGLPDDLQRALERVDAESARMSELVDDLLLLARLDAGRTLEREPVDLTRLAIDATSDARVAAPGHKWRLDLPGDPIVVPGDEATLRQVLANLLSNAAKHTPEGSTVNVALASDQAAGTAELSVTDDGPGIPAALQPELFERFVRGDSSRSRAAGSGGSTGLGLSIVQAVIHAHGGHVAVASQPGLTRFAVTLPQA